jgi:hypothetical protein
MSLLSFDTVTNLIRACWAEAGDLRLPPADRHGDGGRPWRPPGRPDALGRRQRLRFRVGAVARRDHYEAERAEEQAGLF